MTIEQIIVIAVVQGITEFLPISSSGHLILIPALTGWPDQGQFTDVMVHLGTLAAILIYFWRDVFKLIKGALLLFKREVTPEGRLAIYIALATIPAIAFGLVLEKLNMPDLERNVAVVAWNTILYAILMLIADMWRPQNKSMADMTLPAALFIGAAQALALIPGTSRSGVTITAGRFLGFTRPDAARFSFLLGIPAIAGAGLFEVKDAVHHLGADAVTPLCVGIAVAAITGYASISWLVRFLSTHRLTGFAAYRVALALLLIALLATHTLSPFAGV